MMRLQRNCPAELEIDDMFDTDFVCPEQTRRVVEGICDNEAACPAARREELSQQAAGCLKRESAAAGRNRRGKIQSVEPEPVPGHPGDASTSATRLPPLGWKRNCIRGNRLLRLDREMPSSRSGRKMSPKVQVGSTARFMRPSFQVRNSIRQFFKQEPAANWATPLAECQECLQATLDRWRRNRVRRTDIVLSGGRDCENDDWKVQYDRCISAARSVGLPVSCR